MVNLDDLTHLTADEIEGIHDDILAQSPGLKGHRPDLSSKTLIGRIQNNLIYGNVFSLEEVAALYAEVIARGHVFNDGNKRTALICMLSFLDVNGFSLTVDQVQVAQKIEDIAQKKVSYKEFAPWLKSRLRGDLPEPA